MACRLRCHQHNYNDHYNVNYKRQQRDNNNYTQRFRNSVTIQQITESSQKAVESGKNADTSTKLIVQSDNDKLLQNTELKHKMSQSASEAGGLKTWDQLTIISFQKADTNKD